MHATEIESESHAWLAASHMLAGADTIEHFRRSKIGVLAARTNPTVPRDSLRLLNDWYNWLFAFDDAFCEGELMGHRASALARALPPLLEILDGRKEPDATDPFGLALSELLRRMSDTATPAQVDRWRITVKEYLFAQVWEAANREVDLIPTPEDYVLMRRITGATYTCLALIDVGGGYRLKRRNGDIRTFACSPTSPTISSAGTTTCCRTPRSAATTRLGTTWSAVLATHTMLTLQEALQEVARCTTTPWRPSSRLAVPRSWASLPVRNYVHGLEHWVRGHIEYLARQRPIRPRLADRH